jgi:hypothetical protein
MHSSERYIASLTEHVLETALLGHARQRQVVFAVECDYRQMLSDLSTGLRLVSGLYLRGASNMRRHMFLSATTLKERALDL